MSWLREIRKSMGLTQQQVANKTGLSLCFYCQIEMGNRKPSVDNAKNIAQVLDFDWTKIFE